MAKAFKDYTIEDLYRLNFSFLVQSIKDKELQDSSLNEEAFIAVQKKALMNIFASLDAKNIDSSLQIIEPFLIGRRLETDLIKIQAIVEAITTGEIKSVSKEYRQLNVELTDELSQSYSSTLSRCKFGANDTENKIKNARESIAHYEANIAQYNIEILNNSRKIYEQKQQINNFLVLLANEKLKGVDRINPLTDIIHHLQSNRFHIIGISQGDNYSKIYVHTARVNYMKMKDPDNSRREISMPILTFITFRMENSGITVYGNRSANRYAFGSLVSSYYHPHISDSESGSFCLGNTAALLSRITQQGVYSNIGDFVKVYADLLDTYNPESPYRILQEIFCNGVNILVNMRRHVSLKEPSYYGAIDCERMLQDRHILEGVKNVSHILKNNVNSGFDRGAVEVAVLAYLKAFRESINPHLVSIIENSDISYSNFPNNYFSQISGLGYTEMAIKFLKLFGGLENETIETEDAESYESEEEYEESEDN